MSAAADAALARYLAGEVSAPLALMLLLLELRQGERVAALLDSRAGGADPAVRERLAELRRTLDSHPQAEGVVAALLASDRAGASAATTIAAWRDAFDRAVAVAPEASVALYALGSPDLLEAATAEVVEALRSWGLLGRDRRVLEIGCGIGRFAAALAGEVQAYLGLDIAAGMVAEARRRCAGLADVRIETCSGEDLAGLADAEFDLVLAIDSFPYLVEVGMALAERHVAEAARVLRPGGHLAIFNFSYRGDVDRDVADLRRLAERAGLAVLRSGTRDLALWDGVAFLMQRPAQSRGDQRSTPTRFE